MATTTKKLQVFGSIKGEPGADGVGISSIEQTTASTEDGGENILTITLTNDKKYEAKIQNGKNGEPGVSGVYVGSGDMPEGYNVQIDPDSEPDDLVTREEFSQLSDTVNDLKENGTGTGSGLTQAQITALDGMFKVCGFSKDDVAAEYEAFKTAFGITGSGGEEEPDKPEEPDVSEVTLSATYTGGEVAVGTSVNSLTGITVKATYSDGSTKNVTDYTLSGTIAEGSNTITVSYNGLTATFTVTGVAESTGGEETNVSNETGWTDGVAYTYTAVNNEYVETSGIITTYNNWNRTPYLYCKGASKLRFVVNKTSSMFVTNNQYNVFYDENKNFIGSFSYDGIDGNTVGAYKEVEIPNNAAYFIASHKAGIIGESTSLNNGYMLGFIPYK